MKLIDWIVFRYRRATGQLPWWWESDRRKSAYWSADSEALMVQAKREGMF